uniref:transposase n=1 Tax=Spirosoma profusum TaxID=2771354 RepID=UPI003743E020
MPQTATLTGSSPLGRPRNDLDASVNRFVAELANDTRWQIETFHRSFKQLTGSERCQCRKARSQRNHLACCYQA